MSVPYAKSSSHPDFEKLETVEMTIEQGIERLRNPDEYDQKAEGPGDAENYFAITRYLLNQSVGDNTFIEELWNFADDFGSNPFRLHEPHYGGPDGIDEDLQHLSSYVDYYLSKGHEDPDCIEAEIERAERIHRALENFYSIL